MKKFRNLAYTGAIALVGMVGFNSCSSDATEEVKTNPNYNAETNEVLTQFVFNVAANTQANTTKMTAADVQQDGSFRGMDNVHIFTFQLANNKTANGGGSHVFKGVDAAGVLPTATRNYDLSELLTSGDISASENRRIIEISLPVGTNSLLFYGKALKTSGAASNDAQGNTTHSITSDPSTTTFSSVARLTDASAYTATQKALADVMTRIAKNGLYQENTTDGDKTSRDLKFRFWWLVEKNSARPNTGDRTQNATTDDCPTYLNASNVETILPTPEGTNTVAIDGDPAKVYTFESNASYNSTAVLGTNALSEFKVGQITTNVGTFELYEGSVKWYEYCDRFNDGTKKLEMKPLEEILGEAYAALPLMEKDGKTEIRAGSAEAILKMVQDLWQVTDKVASATPTNIQEHIAKCLGKRIETRFSTYFGGSKTEPTFKNDLTTQLVNYYAGRTASDYTGYNVGSGSNMFPLNFGLPMGAAQMDFDKTTHTFSYVTDIKVWGGATGYIDKTSTAAKYLYPTELWYFGNSPVRTSDKEHAKADYPQTVTNWDTDAQWTADWTKDSYVKSTDLSVAMQKDINYGNSLLKAVVTYDGVTTLNDNNHAFHDAEPDNTITVSDNCLQLTGILIGGQPNQVGWDFTPTGTDFSYIVYDKAISGTLGTSSDITNYTLVWDNYDNSKAVDAQNNVFVALEFKNATGKNFWGRTNMVRNGGTFYLVGTLNVSGKTFPTRTYTNYNMPPYAATTAASYAADNGATVEAVRAFIQDFMTTATFKLNANSLKNAYVTVPDLRASQISLGLSVDINWEPGLSFDVTL
ncbi:MAG: hypothetical protein ILA34_02885 [Bacteroidaceae bacterium]|nr:hypothetical protein [Bacteroidaceae bacterium]